MTQRGQIPALGAPAAVPRPREDRRPGMLSGRLAAAVAGCALLVGCSTAPRPAIGPAPPSTRLSAAAPGPRAASPVGSGIGTARAERNRTGDPDWAVMRLTGQHDVEGYADHDSVLPGQPVRLFVSTVAGRFRVVAFRMGWYRGARARPVWTSSWLPGGQTAE